MTRAQKGRNGEVSTPHPPPFYFERGNKESRSTKIKAEQKKGGGVTPNQRGTLLSVSSLQRRLPPFVAPSLLKILHLKLSIHLLASKTVILLNFIIELFIEVTSNFYMRISNQTTPFFFLLNLRVHLPSLLSPIMPTFVLCV